MALANRSRTVNTLRMVKHVTGLFQPLLKPVESHENHQDIDKTQVGNNWNEVDEQLLVGLQVLHINTTGANQQSFTPGLGLGNRTNVFSPDSVDELTPKK
jgi:hypothetical protein